MPTGAAKNLSPGQNLVTSRQFGAANQIDLFLIDNTGTLNVYWVQSAGAWNGPVVVGPVGYAPKGAPLAVSQQVGAPNQTDVFVVGYDGSLGIFWVQGTGGWSVQPFRIAPAGSFKTKTHLAASQRAGVPNQTDVFLVDTTGTLTMFSVTGTGSWSGPTKIGPTGLAPTSAQSGGGAFLAACPQAGVANQTDVFLLNQNGTNAPGWPMVAWSAAGGPWSGPKALVAEV